MTESQSESDYVYGVREFKDPSGVVVVEEATRKPNRAERRGQQHPKRKALLANPLMRKYGFHS